MSGHDEETEDHAELQAYVDGELLPKSEASVPVTDAGFKWGYAVFDSLRTFDGDPVFIDHYLDRIRRSARGMRIDLPMTRSELRDVVTDVVSANRPLLERNGDMKIPIYISGQVPGRSSGAQSVVVVPSAISFADYAGSFIDGASLVTARTRHVSPETFPPTVKSSARLHFRLADIEAHRQDPDARTLMLDGDGNVTELTSANIFIVRDGEVLTPPSRNVLEGVTRERVLELADEHGIPAREKELGLYDVYNADEAFYTSSSKTIVPVTEVDGTEINGGRPGEVTGTLVEAFSESVGVDVVEQFLAHLPAEDRPDRLRLGGDRGVA